MKRTKKIEVKCTEKARITLPWGDDLLNYCPVHANQMVLLGKAIGSQLKAQLLPKTSVLICDHPIPLTEKEKELAKQFKL